MSRAALFATLGSVFLAVTAPAGLAQQLAAPTLEILEAADHTLDEFLWVKRPVIVFADSAADPRFSEQMRLLLERPSDLVERDVVVITDTDPSAKSALRTKLRPRGFMMVLIGKDGGVKLRKPSPWSAREISRSIDKMPMRQREIREQKSLAGG